MNKTFNQRPNNGRGKRPVTRKTSWGKSADWYSVMLEQGGTYQSDLILPNLKRLVAPEKGDNILDLACGQGFFSREFALAGAKVCGVDISPELIAKAKIMSPSLKIDYRISAAHELDAFEDGSFDKIISVLAIQNIHNPDEVFKACGRILAPNGSLYLVLNHPTFRIPTHSSWGWDEQDNLQYRRVDRYLSEFKSEIQMHPGSNSSEVTFSYHRPLQTYFKWLRSAGFHIRNVEEWASNRVSDSGPRAIAENSSRKEIPLFMYLEAVRCV